MLSLSARQLNFAFDLLLTGAALAGARVLVPEGHWHDVAWAAVGAWLVWGFGASLLCHYDRTAPRRGPLEDAVAVSLLVGAAVGFVAAAEWGVSRLLPPAWLVALLLWPFAVAARLFVFRPLVHAQDARDDVLIVGAGPLAVATRAMLERGGVINVRGHLRFAHDRGRAPATLGHAGELERVLREMPLSEVYIAGDEHRDHSAVQHAMDICERLGMPFALPAWSVRLNAARPIGVEDGFVHFLSVNPRSLRRLDVKHAFDLLASALALLVLAIPLQLISAAIKLDSKGPVLFRQPRVGLHGRTFWVLKFRSMGIDAELQRDKLLSKNEQSGPVFKIRHDPRVTRVGRLLRKFSLDELPQLINVLRGEMSLVGPRPPLPSEVRQYAPWQLRRLSVRPGITCIWQVSGRNQISFDQWMLLDLRYIDTWTLRSDVGLILRTIPAVLTARGAS